MSHREKNKKSIRRAHPSSVNSNSVDPQSPLAPCWRHNPDVLVEKKQLLSPFSAGFTPVSVTLAGQDRHQRHVQFLRNLIFVLPWHKRFLPFHTDVVWTLRCFLGCTTRSRGTFKTAYVFPASAPGKRKRRFRSVSKWYWIKQEHTNFNFKCV